MPIIKRFFQDFQGCFELKAFVILMGSLDLQTKIPVAKFFAKAATYVGLSLT